MPLSDLFRKKSVEKILQKAESDSHHNSLAKHLGVRDLTAFGVAAIIGAGIFSTIGKASAAGGPAVIILFIFTAVACGFAAFAYAEFASLIPVSGSAYTYSYVAFGELFAWIIGWALIMEYAIGNIVVAISWSDYFTALVNSIPNCHVPEWMTMDYFTAKAGYATIVEQLQNGATLDSLKDTDFKTDIPKYLAYLNAPTFGIHWVLDIPALCINVLITWLVYRGIKESRNASNIMVIIKVVVVLLVIVIGAFYVSTDNWSPFMPNGVGGLLAGISSVFFAYIGFDAISTTAEECKNPQRDLPRSIMYSIIICTILYVAIALVITGLVSYKELNVGDPLSYVFEKISSLQWLSKLIAVSAVVAMASVLLVFQLGQPRIWMAMSRDGLLPSAFSRVHPKFKTPSFSTLFTGLVVGIPILFTDLNLVVDVCSIGTLFAFVLVCAGVLKLNATPNAPRGKFKTPYINARYIIPVLFIIGIVIACTVFKKETIAFVTNKQKVIPANEFVASLNKDELSRCTNYILSKDSSEFKKQNADIIQFLESRNEVDAEVYMSQLPVDTTKKYESGWSIFKHKIPMWIFLIIVVVMTIRSITKQLSFIPLAGMLCCFYMMAELGWKNWLMFSVWLVIGLIIYFLYGKRNSKLNTDTV